jgi:hypothetical protein
VRAREPPQIYDACEARRLPVHVGLETFGRAFEDVFRALGVSKQYTPEACLYVLSTALPKDKWALGNTEVRLDHARRSRVPSSDIP